ncbi:hypothetical protein EQ828_03470, partial [Ectopseudomonas mendocina]
SCSKIEQKQLNTWVSFQSAEQPLLGQFSVSGNSLRGAGAGGREYSGGRASGAGMAYPNTPSIVGVDDLPTLFTCQKWTGGHGRSASLWSSLHLSGGSSCSLC